MRVRIIIPIEKSKKTKTPEKKSVIPITASLHCRNCFLPNSFRSGPEEIVPRVADIPTKRVPILALCSAELVSSPI